MKSLSTYILESTWTNCDEQIESISADFLKLIDLCVKNQEKGKVSWGYEAFEDEKLHKTGLDLCKNLYSNLMSIKGKMVWNESNCKKMLGHRNKSRGPQSNSKPEYFLIASYSESSNSQDYRYYVVNYSRSLGYIAQLILSKDSPKIYLKASESTNLVRYTSEDKEDGVKGAMFPISEEVFEKLTKVNIPK